LTDSRNFSISLDANQYNRSYYPVRPQRELFRRFRKSRGHARRQTVPGFLANDREIQLVGAKSTRREMLFLSNKPDRDSRTKVLLEVYLLVVHCWAKEQRKCFSIRKITVVCKETILAIVKLVKDALIAQMSFVKNLWKIFKKLKNVSLSFIIYKLQSLRALMHYIKFKQFLLFTHADVLPWANRNVQQTHPSTVDVFNE